MPSIIPLTLSEKVIRGMTENVTERQVATGGAMVPLATSSTQTSRFEIDPSDCSLCGRNRSSGTTMAQTMREIRDWLNEKGVKNQRGGADDLSTPFSIC